MSGESQTIKLTDFLDLATLQEIQDSFAAVANVRAVIADAEGQLLTQPTPTEAFLARQRAIGQSIEQNPRIGSLSGNGDHVAPIIVNHQQLGTIRMASSNEAPAAVQFLSHLANTIARLCYQEYELRQRVSELQAVTNVATMLAEARELNQVLQRTAQLVCEVMQVKAASIRLIDEEHDELVTKAVWNLSSAYLAKGPILLSKSSIDAAALSPQGYEYVRDMTSDPRVQYPGEAEREGIVSMLSVGMRYQGKAIGVLRVYTAQEQKFNPLQVSLLKAVAAQAAAAIENARLASESLESERLERQVRMAAEVQMRMLPRRAPRMPGLDIASVYVPTHELGGDFFDFIPLPDDNLGLVIADVSGKGVPASLIMASVRASLRAQVDYLYYLYEVMSRVNRMLHRDVKMGEFVTLFYGVLDTRNNRLTYCNAGHPPPLVMRDGQMIELSSENTVLGIHPDEHFNQTFIHLRKGDTLLLYTDGLCDAMNFNGEMFGAQRVRESLLASSGSADTIAQNILWHMRRFVGLTTRSDDITMVVTRIT